MMAKLGNRTVTGDVLSTTMCLVEQILNLKPLTIVSDDPEYLEALTPNHVQVQQPHSFLTLSDIQI